MAGFETINRGGHTYKRRKGSRDQWVDENGNVVDLSTGKRRVTSQASARIGSGNNLANPDVWIINGKAYSDSSHGGYKTSYFNAVKRLGQNLGWSVKAGSQSERNLKAQNKKFNASKSRLSSGKIGRITDDGNARGYQTSKSSTPAKTTTSVVVDKEAPLVATTSPTSVKSYLPASKETIPSVQVEPTAFNLKALPWQVEAKVSTPAPSFKDGGKIRYFL